MQAVKTVQGQPPHEPQALSVMHILPFFNACRKLMAIYIVNSAAVNLVLLRPAMKHTLSNCATFHARVPCDSSMSHDGLDSGWDKGTIFWERIQLPLICRYKKAGWPLIAWNRLLSDIPWRNIRLEIFIVSSHSNIWGIQEIIRYKSSRMCSTEL